MAEDSRYKEPPKIARLSQNAKADYYKPIVLPNHQTAFRRFTHATIIGIGIYMIFFHDYGYEGHCFSWIRQQASIAKKKILKLDPTDEKKLQKMSTEK